MPALFNKENLRRFHGVMSACIVAYFGYVPPTLKKSLDLIIAV